MKFKYILYLLGVLAVGGICWKVYGYLFTKERPTIELIGIEDNGCYCGEMSCVLSGSSPYKVAHVSVWLDGKPLVQKFKINSKTFDYQFVVGTKTIPNGKHMLKVEAVDGTFKQHTVAREIPFLVDNIPLQAAFVKQDSDVKVFQGRTLHLQFQVNKPIEKATVTIFSQEYDCFPEDPRSLVYECFIPIEYEQVPNEYLFTIDILDRVGNSLKLENRAQVVVYPFKKQRLTIPADKVQQIEKQQEGGDAEKSLNKTLAKLVDNSPQKKLWRGVFCEPSEQARMTTEFGVLRTTQEKGQYRHNGIDIANMPRSVVWAPQDGVVIVKDHFVFSGNTVCIDHGCGIFTLLFHLDSFADINIGDEIKKGNPVGRVGKTGYASGYHLHWEMRINNIPVDPLQWTKMNF